MPRGPLPWTSARVVERAVRRRVEMNFIVFCDMEQLNLQILIAMSNGAIIAV